MPDIKIIILFLSDINSLSSVRRISSSLFEFCRILRLLSRIFAGYQVYYPRSSLSEFCRISGSSSGFCRIANFLSGFVDPHFYLGRSNSDPLLMLVEYVRNNLSNIQFYFKLTYLDNYRKKHMATVSGNIMLIAHAITGKCQTNISTLSPPNNKDENQTNIVHKFITH